MSKLNAIKYLPTEEKLRMSRVFDSWIRDYEAGLGDRDPESWFVERQSEILEDLTKAGVSQSELNRLIGVVGVVAANYYMII